MIRKTLTATLALAALVGFGGTAVADAQSGTGYAWPPSHVEPVHETAAQLEARAARFTARQEKRVPVVVRGAKDVEPGAWGHEATGFFDGQQYLNNVVDYTDRTGEKDFFTQVHAPGHFTHSPKQVCEGAIGPKECTGAVRQPDGGLVLFTESGGAPTRIVYSYRPNGEVVWVQANSLTFAQLAKLATDRAFTFTR